MVFIYRKKEKITTIATGDTQVHALHELQRILPEK